MINLVYLLLSYSLSYEAIIYEPVMFRSILIAGNCAACDPSRGDYPWTFACLKRIDEYGRAQVYYWFWHGWTGIHVNARLFQS